MQVISERLATSEDIRRQKRGRIGQKVGLGHLPMLPLHDRMAFYASSWVITDRIFGGYPNRLLVIPSALTASWCSSNQIRLRMETTICTLCRLRAGKPRVSMISSFRGGTSKVELCSALTAHGSFTVRIKSRTINTNSTAFQAREGQL